MDPTMLSNLVAYSAQVLCLVLAAVLLPSALRMDAPAIRYACWRGTLALCLLLPWVQARRLPQTSPAVPAGTIVSLAEIAESTSPPAVGGVDWMAWLPLLLAAGVVARLLWLGIGFLRLRHLRCAGELAPPADHIDLQAAIGTNAEVRYIAECRQPVTFGVWRPVVLLPAALRAQPVEIREAVLAHELVHVSRRDWAWVLAEETVRGIFWFHPAMWWLISRVQRAREEVVDMLAVSRTGRRRAYVEALLVFADGVPFEPAPAFARRRHLFRRMVLISREDVMTSKRIVISSAVMVVLMAMGGWYAVSAFPMREAGSEQILQKDPGPLERAANPITPENPVPERLHHETAVYPAEAAAARAWVSVTLKMTIDAAGGIAETRVTALKLRTDEMSLSFSGGLGSRLDQFYADFPMARPIIDSVVNAAAAAAERWRFAPPVNAPISIDTTFYFAPGLPVSDTPASASAAPDGRFKDGLRVGGNIRMPLKITDVRPIYPPDALAARVQGVVIIEARIDPEGRVSDARVLRSIPMLDQAALGAVRQWEFQPTLLNGVPTAIIMTMTVQFTLQ